MHEKTYKTKQKNLMPANTVKKKFIQSGTLPLHERMRTGGKPLMPLCLPKLEQEILTRAKFEAA